MAHPRRFDPHELADPVALKTGWGPCQRGGSNFRTHVLVQPSATRVELRPTLAARAFAATFLGIGGVSVVVAGAFVFAPGPGPLWALAPLAFGALFGGVGWALWRSVARPHVFDLARRDYSRGTEAPLGLGLVHALQLVSEYCGGESHFSSYELNLVLRDGRRVNVLDHGNLPALRLDAAELAAFLGVPLWDPT